MLSKVTLELHQEQSKKWWLLLLQKKSLREIAAESNLSFSSVHRRMVKYHGKDYAAKAKSSLVRSLTQPITKPISSERSSGRKQQEAKDWLAQNIGLLAELDSQCPNDFYADGYLENQNKRHSAYNERDDYNRYFQ